MFIIIKNTIFNGGSTSTTRVTLLIPEHYFRKFMNVWNKKLYFTVKTLVKMFRLEFFPLFTNLLLLQTFVHQHQNHRDLPPHHLLHSFSWIKSESQWLIKCGKFNLQHKHFITNLIISRNFFACHINVVKISHQFFLKKV